MSDKDGTAVPSPMFRIGNFIDRMRELGYEINYSTTIIDRDPGDEDAGSMWEDEPAILRHVDSDCEPKKWVVFDMPKPWWAP